MKKYLIFLCTAQTLLFAVKKTNQNNELNTRETQEEQTLTRVSPSDVSELVRPQSAPPSLCDKEFKNNDAAFCDYRLTLLAEQAQNPSVPILKPIPIRIPPANNPHYHAINPIKKTINILSLETTKPTMLNIPHQQESDFFKKLKHASLKKITTEKEKSKTRAPLAKKKSAEQTHQKDYQQEHHKPRDLTITSNTTEIICYGVALALQKKKPF
ncbi:hypothetical protein [Methylicorpusculum sp.]|uniref:hypothetical protein n=1 Tax=Methylicorpusculum sp. TaxID=2713644 RepID=UPI002AB94F56|nr:hypothetical protein [Methylicorpusculum sp.]MDZ4151329.1 hypothetical protein [Methylicorpusculum sp.]